jgi:hypothetical protein
MLADNAEIQKLIKQLASINRIDRLEAARQFDAMPKLPAEAVKPLLRFARSELTDAVVPKRSPIRGERLAEIPFVGDETALVRIKANPNEFVGEPFVIGGMVQVSDLYAGAYRNSSNSYYSLTFMPLTKSAEPDYRDSAYLYVPRQFGAALIEQLATREEGGFDGTVLRARVTLDRNRYQDPESWEYLELLDWQFLSDDRKTWTPWAFEGIQICESIMPKIGKEAMPVLLEIVGIQHADGDPIDALIRMAAAKTLVKMDAKTRQAASVRLSMQSKKTKDKKQSLYLLQLSKELARPQPKQKKS